MTEYSLAEVKEAAEALNWDVVARRGAGHLGALWLHDEPVTFTIVDAKVGSHFDGYEQDAQENFVIFEIGNQLFKKEGWSDSYGDSEWDGNVTEVKASKKYTTVYEPKND
jgi:hypothetical protein